MKQNIILPLKALNKAYRKVKPAKIDFDRFRNNLSHLLNDINEAESEEFHKNLVRDFLKNTWYSPDHFINTHDRTDLVIHNGRDAKSKVGVIIETKKPGKNPEMLQPDKLNTKAFQEMLLYFLRERITNKNLEIKHIIATNNYEWFIFDAQDFESYFVRNKTLIQQFTDFEEGRLGGKKTNFFYEEIASPVIKEISKEIRYTYFDLRDYKKSIDITEQYDKNLILLFKILSPEHLLKLPFVNDSNSLNREFYNELLHIIGLTEKKEGSKKVIGRKEKEKRDSGSLLENAINQIQNLDKLSRLENPLQYGETEEARLFNLGLELCITWINRILFLKLLEAQLINYHQGDKSYGFLNKSMIKNYDDLNHLFFSVLACKYSDRSQEVQATFPKVPFLNSSLFEQSEIEHNAIFISNLRDERKLPVYSRTVLEDRSGKRIYGELNSLEYLLEFLNAFDFSSEGAEDIQEENKALISASVLGLIFEKINGYKDGSFYTPGFITMYMCRETLRRTVIQKFNKSKGWQCRNFDELYNKITDQNEANQIINSLKICDPAVGSGHFLVSALNEIIAIKSDLKILHDRDGRRLKEYHIEVVNDELIINDENNDFFKYKPGNPESQRVQETLFQEKLTIIENCLFGVDINPNSVKICRLRLWIELLKNAYYKAESNFTELETLPNIDINIKCGNSLVNRFGIDANIDAHMQSARWSVLDYKNIVHSYRNTSDKNERHEFMRVLQLIKNDFRAIVAQDSKEQRLINKLGIELFENFQSQKLFDLEYTKAEERKRQAERQKLEGRINALKEKTKDREINPVYNHAFEWRFEFPEVLDNEGKFNGFDVIIGNPPYIRQEELGEFKSYLGDNYTVYAGTADLLVYFFERGMQLLKSGGHFCMITSNKFMKANYGKSIRQFLTNHQITDIIDFGELPVFDEASTFPAIFQVAKTEMAEPVRFTQVKSLDFTSLKQIINETSSLLPLDAWKEDNWSLGGSDMSELMSKIRAKGIPLGEYIKGEIYYGIKTGFNQAFIIDESKRSELIEKDPKSAEIIFPFAIGDDVRNYHIRDNKRFIIFTRRGIDIERYPAIKEHLSYYKDNLIPGVNGGRKPGPYQWYEIQDTVAYHEEFMKPKIVYPIIAKESRFAFSTEPILSNDKTFFIPLEDFYLLGFLNSKLAWFYLKNICSVLGDPDKGGRLELRSFHVSTLPVYPANPEEKEQISAIVQKILQMKSDNPAIDVSELQGQIDEIVWGLYGLGEEDRKLIIKV
jgi:adenine-specific DNA-methyltransferase